MSKAKADPDAAIAAGRRAGYLGSRICGSKHAFDLEVRVGAGAYVCGEETSLLESLEGRRGIVRAKPPLPAHKGLYGKPTVINNVLSFAAIPFILAGGAKAYADYGMGRSRGTMPIQLAGNVKHGGLFEIAFGITLLMKYASSAVRKVLNIGKVVKIASAIVSTGTRANTVVKVRPPATWGRLSSRKRRRANCTRSRNSLQDRARSSATPLVHALATLV